MVEKNKANILKLNGVDYNTSDLSDNAKSQMQGIQVADVEIKRLNVQLALMQTARNAYMQALQNDLPEIEQPELAS